VAYDDNLRIYAGIDQSGIIDGMNDMNDNVRRGMDAVNDTAENGMNQFGALAQAGAVAAGQALFSIAGKAEDVFGDILSSGDKYNQAMNQLSASTGAVGEDLEALKEVSKDVFANNYGEDYNDVANAVANVKKQLGDIPDDEIASVTESAFALRDTFEYEIGESTRAAKAMVDNFGISGERAMELIAAGAQNGLDYSGELIDSISEYSVQFAKVGLDADDMFNIFQKGAESGAWNLDKVGDAVKEFSIRAIDGSKTTMEGFTAIGLNADEMSQKFGQGGETAKQAFSETISALSALEDPIAKDATGVALFGTMWEDLGADTVASLAEIQDGVYDTGEALKSIKEVKYDDIGSAFEGLKRSIGSFTIDARSAFSANIADSIGTFVNALNSADGDISVVLDGVVNALKQASSAVGTVAKGWLENGKKVIEYLVQGIQKNLPVIQKKAVDILKFLVNGFLNARKRMLEAAVPIIQGIAEGITQTLPELIDKGLEILQNLIAGIIGAIPQLLPLAVNIITSLVNGLAQSIVAVLEFAPQVLTTLIDGIISVLPLLIECAVQILDALITAIIDNLEPILTACIEILMAIVNGIIGNLDRLIDAAFQLIQFLIDELLKNDNLQKILNAAIAILLAVSDGIIQNLDKLINAAFQIISKIISELLQSDNIKNLIDTGIKLLVKIIEGICDLAGRFAEFAGDLFSEIGNALSEIDWAELGKNIIEGICSGLLDVDFSLDEYLGDFKDNWVTGFKELFDIHSPSRVMRDEIGKFILPGIVVGVEDTSDETADGINSSLDDVISKISIPKLDSQKIELNPPEITESDMPELNLISVKLPEINIPEQSEIDVELPNLNISEPEPLEFNSPEITESDMQELNPISVELPEISVSEQSEIDIESPNLNISEPEPIEFDSPEVVESGVPEFSPISVEFPEINVPEQSEIDVESPNLNISEPEPIEFDSPEIAESESGTFTQQIELLREFSPENNIPQIADERITEDIQTQLDEFFVNLNADEFISKFENILANAGISAVPQYSEVYNQVRNPAENHENNRFELPKNSGQSTPKISVFIGDEEIKNFVISAIDEANAISGGASV